VGGGGGRTPKSPPHTKTKKNKKQHNTQKKTERSMSRPKTEIKRRKGEASTFIMEKRVSPKSRRGERRCSLYPRRRGHLPPRRIKRGDRARVIGCGTKITKSVGKRHGAKKLLLSQKASAIHKRRVHPLSCSKGSNVQKKQERIKSLKGGKRRKTCL